MGDARTVGGYQLDALIVERSFSAVFLGHHLRNGETRVIKVHDCSRTVTGVDTSRSFRRELSALAVLHHPGIVDLIEFGLDQSTTRGYLVLEHLGGPDLATAAVSVSRQTLLTVLLQAFSALDYLHRRGLVHGDLKPHHFKLQHPLDSENRPPRLKLLDLGACTSRNTRMDSHELSLTPGYAAPEVFSERKYSHLSDLYSMGAILLDCLGITRESTAADKTLARTGSRQHPELAFAPRSFEDDLARLAYFLLESDPHKRTPSASEAIRQLSLIAARHGLQAPTAEDIASCFERPIFVGSEALIRQISGLIDRTLQEASQPSRSLVLVTGPPGIGRSRVLRELAVLCALRGVSPLLADSGPPELDPSQLSAPCIRPAALLCDIGSATDLTGIRQWLNQVPTPRLPAMIVLAAPPSLLASCTMESDSARSLGFDTCTVTLELLDRQQIQLSLRKTLAIRNVADSIVSHVYAASAGHPGRAWTLVTWAIANGTYLVEHDSLEQVSKEHVSLPPSIASDCIFPLLTGADGLTVSIARVTALASVPLTLRDLTIALSAEEALLASACAHLLRQGLISAVDTDPPSYRIAGSIACEALLRDLPTPVEKGLHALLASALRQSSPIAERRHALGIHSLACGDTDRAVAAFREAAELAASIGDHRQAICSLSEALALSHGDPSVAANIALDLCIAHQPLRQWPEVLAVIASTAVDDSLEPRLACRLHLARALALHETGRHHEAVTASRRALRMARAIGAAPEQADALYVLGTSLCWIQRRSVGVKHLVRSMQMARQQSRLDLLGSCCNDFALALWTAGKYRLALAYERRKLQLHLRGLNDRPTKSASSNIGVLLTDLGRYTAAKRAFRSVGLGVRTLGKPADRGPVLANFGEVYRSQGEWKVALRLYQAGLDVFTRFGQPHRAAVAINNIALTLCKSGFTQESNRQLVHRLSDRSLSGDARYRMMYLLTWCRLLLGYGAFGKAHRVAAHALRLAYDTQLTSVVLEAKSLMARALIRLGSTHAGVELLRGSLKKLGNKSPFEVRLTARLCLAEARSVSSASTDDKILELDRIIRISDVKGMHNYECEATLLKASLLLECGDVPGAQALARNMTHLSRRTHDRIMTWRSHYWLGRAYEQGLRYRRALRCYRVATLVVQELARDIPRERFRRDFLAQFEARDSLDRYARLQQEVGRRARHDLASLSRSEATSRRMLASLSAIGQQLASILDLDRLLASILDLAIENVGAERGVVFLRSEGAGDFRAESARGLGGRDLEDLSRFSRSVIEQAGAGRTLVTVDVGQDPALQHIESVTVNEIKSILCVPMRARGRVVGVLYLDTQRHARMFSERDRAFVESFASQAAIAIENARLFGTMREENSRLRQEVEGRFAEIVGSSAAIRRLRETIAGLLDNDCTVLITGESGTGKEVVARAIHSHSQRRQARFMAIDCGALPEHLLEAELFGFRKGAFTGAERDRLGLIEEADGGTLFLDEVTNTSLAFQSRLLRVLQEREVRRLGENETRRVDVRVIAATNADIHALMAAGRFRQDLYYRLNVVTIDVPPLRARIEDIPLLAQHFLARRVARPDGAAASPTGGVPAPRVLGPGVVDAFMAHPWHGNVRELENLIERLCVLTRGEVIRLRDLETVGFAAGVSSGSAPGDAAPGPRATAAAGRRTGEQMMIEDALRRHRGDKAKAARFIGWNRQKLYRRMKTYAIPKEFGKAA